MLRDKNQNKRERNLFPTALKILLGIVPFSGLEGFFDQP